jgi:hypothetical protein
MTELSFGVSVVGDVVEMPDSREDDSGGVIHCGCDGWGTGESEVGRSGGCEQLESSVVSIAATNHRARCLDHGLDSGRWVVGVVCTVGTSLGACVVSMRFAADCTGPAAQPGRRCRGALQALRGIVWVRVHSGQKLVELGVRQTA